ncbi:MAG: DUF2127 domain-containing protein [Candidatus Omnitrophica bacterium]|nr:DUF2127 domain-containing protein [Candidatus Omnitrophota bacterium]
MPETPSIALVPRTASARTSAPALSGIIFIKLAKGLIFLALAVVAFSFSNNDLPEDFRNLLQWLHLNPERQFFIFLAAHIDKITQTNVLWAASLTLFYSLFSLAEAIGLILRFSWAGWMGISESAFFIPIELYDLFMHRLSLTVLGILILNIFIFWYLLSNRKRLFHRFYFHRNLP